MTNPATVFLEAKNVTDVYLSEGLGAAFRYADSLSPELLVVCNAVVIALDRQAVALRIKEVISQV